MTEKTFCDRCGKAIKDPNKKFEISIYSEEMESEIETTKGDLCPKCMQFFKSFLEKELKFN